MKAGFAAYAERSPNAPAIVDPSGEVLSRHQLLCRANQLAHALRAEGLAAGDTVAILSPNCSEYLQTYLAALQLGLYIVCINFNLAGPEIAYILDDSACRAVVAHNRLRLVVRNALASCRQQPRTLVSIGPLDGFTDVGTLCSGQPTDPLSDSVQGRMLTYTSATTGRPKGVQLPLQDAQTALERSIRLFQSCGIELESGNVHLCCSTLYHAGPLDWAALALHMGHLLVLTERWSPEGLLQSIDAHRVTTTLMVPAMFVRMLKLPAAIRQKYATSSLRIVAHSGAPCPVDVKRQMIEWWGPILWESYGSSEGSGTLVSSHDWLRYPGTVGKPIPGSSIRILDEHGVDVPSNVVGSVYMKRYTGDRFEYRGDPEKTHAAYLGDHFTVGDLGYLNDEGYLFLCDRKADMIISGGMNIYPAEVERVLIQHPAVLDCAVFGVPDELLGQAIVAVVELRADSAGIDDLKTAVNQFLSRELGAAKLPRRVECVERLPRDPNGKIYKRLLRQTYGGVPA